MADGKNEEEEPLVDVRPNEIPVWPHGHWAAGLPEGTARRTRDGGGR
eukprot:CAMPEP_0119425104 /NCGR_PEP_ID=MMETSP1335-20130426/33877_1 /TAXON_ID=259385 /ORGANISM="Chrysoculter rhomboideus, Strain RCC1486" /LENGTH=46 /DNA_ID= /DNA_START= /DNA_END= /DNA_ORIENTATION=